MSEGAAAGRAHFGDENVLPDPVQAERHQIVHQVVAVGDFMKDVVDEALFFLERNAFVAEMGFFARRIFAIWRGHRQAPRTAGP